MDDQKMVLFSPRSSVKRGRRWRRRSRSRRRQKTVEQKNQGSMPVLTTFNRYNNPVPKTWKLNLRYFENALSINPGAGGGADEYVFSANGLYDPNVTGTGHQPLGFDQLMAMYNHYTVIASTITVMARNADSTYGQFLGVRLAGAVAESTDPQQIIENGRCTYRMLNQGGQSNDQATVSYGCNVSKFLGRPNILSEDDLRGTLTTNPAEEAYFKVFGFADQAVDGNQIIFAVQIDYVAIFTEPVLMTTS